ncbi:MAG: hypothetical protein PHS23_06450 [Candidatus Cloacimonetes bacterium]|nr:hypothetical protein [Candidatus Cloacimonadota bacterium]
MGQQQILLIVLGVVVVGLAIAAGIWMFQYYAYTTNLQALLVELDYIKVDAYTYWTTPHSLGGAGKDPEYSDIYALAGTTGFQEQYGGKVIQVDWVRESENGSFRLISFYDGDMTTYALGKASRRGKHPFVNYAHSFVSSKTKIDIGSEEGFPATHF